MKKSRTIIVISYIMSLMFILSGCQKDARIEVLQEFILKQVQCETYKEAAGDTEVLKKSFERFFTEETYQRYLDDVVGYMYTQLYYVTNANQVKIKSVICKSVTSQEDGLKTYTFEVNYHIW